MAQNRYDTKVRSRRRWRSSLVAFELETFAFMALSRLVFLRDAPLGLDSVTYWFVMQLAMIVGFATSYPANLWLVRSRLKESL